MRLELSITNAAGTKEQIDLPLRAGRPVVIKATPGAHIALSVEGVKQTGAVSIDGKKLVLKKSGKDLLLQLGDETVVRIDDFYVADKALLEGTEWSFKEGLGSLGVDSTGTGLMVTQEEGGAALLAEAETASGAHWGAIAAAVVAGGAVLAVSTQSRSSGKHDEPAAPAGSTVMPKPVPVVADTVVPTVMIASDHKTLLSGQTAKITFTLSEPVKDFASTKMKVAGGTLSALTPSADGLSYTAVFTPDANSTVPASISLPAGAFADPAGNKSAALDLPLATVNTQEAPVVITPAKADLQKGESTKVDIDLKGGDANAFDPSKVQVDNGTLSDVKPDPDKPGHLTGTLTAGNDEKPVTLTVPADSYKDADGKPGAEVTQAAAKVDSTAPTVKITSDDSTLRAGETAKITFTPSEPVKDFDKTPMAVTGGTLSALTPSADGLSYTAVFTPDANSTVPASISLPAGAFADPAGNKSAALDLPLATVNTQEAPVVITPAKADLQKGESTKVDIDLKGGDPKNFDSSKVQVDNGTLSDVKPDPDKPGHLTGTLTAGNDEKPVTLTVPADSYKDADGKPGAEVTQAAAKVDSTAPTVKITSDDSTLRAGETAKITFTPSEPVKDFDKTPMAVTGGTLSALTPSADGLSYTAVFTPDANSTVPASISLPAGAFADPAGNKSAALDLPIATVNTQEAPVVITPAKADLQKGESTKVDIDLKGGDANAFDPSKVQVDNGTLSDVKPDPDKPGHLTGTLTAGNDEKPVTLTVPAGSYKDADGKPGAEVTQAAAKVDSTAPTVKITSDDSTLRAGETAKITFTPSEPVKDFDKTPMAVTGGTLSALTPSADGLSYTAVFTPDANSTVPASISLPAGAFADPAGNKSAALDLPIATVNTQEAPVVITPAKADLQKGESTKVDIDLKGGDANAFDPSKVQVDNGTLSDVKPDPDKPGHLTGTLTAGNDEKPVTLTVPADSYKDADGKPGAEVTQAAAKVDSTAPTVKITSDDSTLRAGETAKITFTPSEPVKDFDKTPMAVTGGTLSALTPSADGLSYTAVFTPDANSTVPASISLPAGAFADPAGNKSAALDLPLATVNTQEAPVVITPAKADLQKGESTKVDIDLKGGDPKNFDSSKVQVDNGTLSDVKPDPDKPGHLTGTLTAGNDEKPVTLTVPADSYKDADGKPGAEVTQAAAKVDSTAPTVKITSDDSTLRAGETAKITFTPSEPVKDFDKTPMAVTGGTLSALTPSADGLSYTAVFTPDANSTVPASISLPAGAFADPAGNKSAALDLPLATVNTQEAPVVITPAKADLQKGESTKVDIDLKGGDPKNFDSSKVQVDNGTLSDVKPDPDKPGHLTGTLTAGNDEKPVTLTVPADSYKDADGKPGAEVTQAAAKVDSTAPTVKITSDDSTLRAGETAKITFTPSEPVKDFDKTPMAVTGGTLSALTPSADGLSYTAVFTPDANSTVPASISLPAGAFADPAGNKSAALDLPIATVNTQEAPVVITPAKADLQKGESTKVDIDLKGGDANAFDPSKVQVDNGTLSDVKPDPDKPGHLTGTLTAGNDEKPVTLTVPAGSYKDADGKPGAEVTQAAAKVDSTAPTVKITSDDSTLRAGETAKITFTPSEPVKDFDKTPMAVTGGTLSALTPSADGLSYTAVFTPDANSTVPASISLPAGAFADPAGNKSAALDLPIATVNTQEAPVVITPAKADLQKGESTKVDIDLKGGDANAFDPSKVQVDNGTLSDVKPDPDKPGHLTGTLTAGNDEKPVTLTVPAGSYKDADGKPGAEVTQAAAKVDSTAPTVKITSDDSTLRAGETAKITFTPSEPVKDFDKTPMAVTGGTLSALTPSADGLSYTAVFTPDANSTVPASISLPAGAFADPAGNKSAALDLPIATVNTQEAPVVITPAKADLQKGESTKVDIDLKGGDANAFDPSKVQVDNGTLSDVKPDPDKPGHLTGTLTAGNDEKPVTLTVPADSYKDADGKPGAEVTQAAAKVDSTAPTVKITSDDSTLRAGETAKITFTPSEPVKDFDKTPMAVTGGTLSALTPSADGLSYTAVFTPDANSTVPASISLPAGAFADPAGNKSAALDLPIATVNTQEAPVVITPAKADLQKGESTKVDIDLKGGDANAFDPSKVQVDNGTLSDVKPDPDKPGHLTGTLTAGNDEKPVTLTVPADSYKDADGKPGAEVTQAAAKVDSTAPTVKITSDDSTLRAGETAKITFTPSEPVKDFDKTPMAVTGGTLSALTPSADGLSYTAVFTPDANSTVPASISLPAGAFADPAGNKSAALDLPIATVNTQEAPVVITPAKADLQKGESTKVDIDLKGGDANAFDPSKVQVDNGTLSDVKPDPDKPGHLTGTLTAGNDEKPVTLTVPADSYKDADGKPGAEVTQAAAKVDSTAPTVKITSDDSTLRAGETAKITFTPSEPVKDFDKTPMAVTGGTLSALTPSADGLSYTAVFTPDANSTVPASISLPAGAFADPAGNKSAALDLPLATVNTQEAPVVITPAKADLQKGESTKVDIDLKGGDPKNFDSSKVQVDNGTLSDVKPDPDKPGHLTGTLTAGNDEKPVTLTVPADSYKDADGKPGAEVTQAAAKVDSTAPTVKITSDDSTLRAGETAKITFTPSEPVKDFDKTPMAVTGGTLSALTPSADGLSYTAVFTPDANSTVPASISLPAGAFADPAGNKSAALDLPIATVNTQEAPVVITPAKADLQKGESTKVDIDLKGGDANAFDPSKVQVDNGTLSDVKPDPDKPGHLTGTLTAGNDEKPVTLTVPADSYKDADGKPGAEVTQAAAKVDSTAPTVKITSDDSTLRAGETAKITFTPSEPVKDFDKTPMAVTGGTLSALTPSADGLSYTAVFTPDANSTVPASISLPAGAFADPAGNKSAALDLPLATVNTQEAPVVITPAKADLQKGESTKVDIDLKGGDPKNFDSSKVQVDNGTLSDVKPDPDKPGHLTGTLTAGNDEKPVTLTVPADSYKDADGKPGAEVTQAAAKVDSTAPTVKITSDDSTLRAGETAKITFTPSEPVKDFDKTPMAVTGGTLSALTPSADGLSYTAVFTPDANSTVPASISLPAGAFADPAGNKSAALDLPIATVNTQEAPVVITPAKADLQKGESTKVDIDLKGGDANAFDPSKVQVDNGTLSDVKPDPDKPGHLTGTLTAGNDEKPVTLTVPAGSYKDADGKPGAEVTQAAAKVDSTAPTVKITSDDSTLRAGETAKITFTPSEPVKDFDKTPMAVTGGTLSALTPSADGLSYTAVFTPDANSTVPASISLPAGAFADPAGNKSAALDLPLATVNTQEAPVVITPAKADLQKGESTKVDIDLKGGDANAFDPSKVQVDNGTLSDVKPDPDKPGHLTGTLTAGNDEKPVTLTVPADSYKDADGKPGAEVTQAAAKVDSTAPTVKITSDDSTLRAGETAKITFTPSEPVKDFDKTPMAVTGGTLSALTPSADGLSYTAVFTPDANSTVPASISLPAGAFADPAGNKSAALDLPIATVNTQEAPVVITPAKADLQKGESTKVDIDLKGGDANAFDPSKVQVDNGTLSDVKPDPDKPGHLTGTLTAGNDEKPVTLTVPAGSYKDADGKPGAEVTQAAAKVDSTAPTVKITSDDSTLRAGETAKITFTPSEPVKDFDKTPMAVTGGTLSALTPSADGLSYTAVFTPDANSTVPASISLPAGAFADPAGNKSAALDLPIATVNTQEAPVVITPAKADLQKGESTKVDIDLKGGDANAFDPSKVQVDNGTLSDVKPDPDKPGHLTGTLTAGNDEKPVTLTVPAGSYKDADGKPGAEVTQAAAKVDSTAPTVKITSDDSTLRAGETAKITFTPSEPVKDFDKTPMAVTGGTLSALTPSADGLSYTAVFTPDANSTVPASISLPAGAFADPAGNKSAALDLPLATVNTQEAPVVITPAKADLQKGESTKVDIDLKGGDANAFDPSKVQVDNGTLSDVKPDPDKPGHLTGTLTAGNDEKPVTLTVPADSYKDADGKPGAEVTQAAAKVDSTAPTVKITSDDSTLRAGETAKITFTPSEPVKDFDKTPMAVTGGTLSALTPSADGLSYTAVFTPDANSTVPASISLPAGAFADPAGNKSAALDLPLATVNTQEAPVVITPAKADLQKGESTKVDIDLKGGDPKNFDSSKVQVDNGTLSDVKPDPDKPGHLTGTLTAGNDEKPVTLTVPAGSYKDADGKPGAEVTQAAAKVDDTSPALAITSNRDKLLAGQTADITFTFSEKVKGFEKDDVKFDGGTLGDLKASTDGLSYTATFTPTAGTTGDASVNVAAGTYTDLAGKNGLAGKSLALGINTAQAAAVFGGADSGPAGQPMTKSITLPYVPKGLDANDLASPDGSISNLRPDPNDPKTTLFDFTPKADLKDGAKPVIKLDGNGYTTPEGLRGDDAQSQGVSIDNTAPTLVITSDRSELLAGQTAEVTFTFSEKVKGFEKGDVQFAGGTLGDLKASADGLSYTATFTPTAKTSGAASITVAAASYTDLAGNNGAAGASPVLAINTLQDAAVFGGADSGPAGQPMTKSITLPYVPKGLDASDLSSPDGSISNLRPDPNDPKTTLFDFTPNADLKDGAKPVIKLDGSGYTTPEGLRGDDAQSQGVSIDNTAPTLVITSDRSQLLAGQTAEVTFTFSEKVKGFEKGDVKFDGGTLGDLKASTDGLSYTATFTPTAGTTGNASVKVAADTYTDLAGNNGLAEKSLALGINTAQAAAVFGGADSGPAGQPMTKSITLPYVPKGLDASDLSSPDGSISNLRPDPNDPKTTLFDFTPKADLKDGAKPVIKLDGSGYTTPEGLRGDDAQSQGVSIDNTAPTLAISSNRSQLLAGQTADITFKFSEKVKGFETGDITAVGGTLGDLKASADGLSYTTTFTPTAGTSGKASISVTADGYTDLAGNKGAAATPLEVNVDTVAPTLAISSNRSQLLAGQTTDITFKFSEKVKGFEAGDITAVGGTLGDLKASADGLSYTTTFTPTAGTTGKASISVTADGYTDLAGNKGAAATPLEVNVDTVVPTLAITSDRSELLAGQTAQVKFSFSEKVKGFDANDISITGGKLGDLKASTDGLSYTATFTPTAGTTGNASVKVAADTYTDLAGNNGLAEKSLALGINTAQAAAVFGGADSGPAGQPMTKSITLPYVPKGLDASDLSSPDGSISNLRPDPNDPKTTLFDFTPKADLKDGAKPVIKLDGSGYTTPEGLRGDDAQSQGVSIDNTAPTLAISSNRSQLLAGQTADITFKFSEKVKGFETGDITAVGGTLGDLKASADGLSYTTTFTPTAGTSGKASISVTADGYTDLAGNKGAAATPLEVNVDTVAPTLAISSNRSQLLAGQTTDITFKFSEKVKGFEAGDITAVGGTLGDLKASADGLSYTTTFTPTAGTTGKASISVTADGYTDLAGNKGAAATPLEVNVDTVVPTLAITSDRSELLAGQTAQVKFSFSEKVKGFDANDISITGGKLGDLKASTDGLSYTATFTPTAGTTGNASVKVAADTYTDLAGNNGLAEKSLALGINTAQAAAVFGGADSGPAGQPMTKSITLPYVPKGLDASDLSSPDGSISNLRPDPNDPKTTLFDFTPNADLKDGAKPVIKLDGSGYTTPEGLRGDDAQSQGVSIDNTAPTLVITSDRSQLLAGQTAEVTFTFSEKVKGFEKGDVKFDGGTLGDLKASTDGLSYTATFTPTAGTTGNASVKVAADTYTDLAGNNGLAEKSLALGINTAQAAAVFGGADSGPAGQPMTKSITLPYVPKGLDASDLSSPDGSISNLRPDPNDPKTTLFDFTPKADLKDGAKPVIKLDGSGYTTPEGLRGDDAQSQGVSIDNTAPTLAISSNRSQLLAGQTADITFKFSEKVKGFETGDITAVGGTLGDLKASADGLSYTTTFTPTAGTSGKASISVTADSYTDLAGNKGAAATPLEVNVDTVAPTLAISSNRSQLLAGQTTDITFKFSEKVKGFEAGDITAVGGTLGDLKASADGLSYTTTFTPTAGTTGKASISVTADGYTDLAGNKGAAATPLEVNVDTVVPKLTITDDTGDTAVGPVKYSFAFSEAVKGFTTDNITLAHGSKGVLEGGGLLYTMTVTPPATGAGADLGLMVNTAYTDMAGNAPANTVVVSPQPYGVKALELTALQSLNNVSNLDVQSLLALNFTQDIALGSGQIRIVDDMGTAGWTVSNLGKTVTDTTKNDVVITLSNGVVTDLTIGAVSYKDVGGVGAADKLLGSVKVVGSELIIDPLGPDNLSDKDWDFDWDFASNYHVELDAGVVSAKADPTLKNAALTDKTQVHFTTVTPQTLASTGDGALSQKQSNEGTLSDSYTYHLGNLGDPRVNPPPKLDFSNGPHALVLLSQGGNTRKAQVAGNVDVQGFGQDDLIYNDNLGDMTMATTENQSGGSWTGGALRVLGGLDYALQTKFSDYLTLHPDWKQPITGATGGDKAFENDKHFNANLIIFG
ncbi:Ig-like domain-containing protein [Pseudomonas yamanorum]|uniref:Ig-like domain-containing protein n=1 Tax=Pseudomonas yamanorum TaxID=515393 RepID=UPI002ED3E09D|nr:Ig-like domain-containing protein [Pseudomonas yamanorum]